MLRTSKITLLSPATWDDKNDAYFMAEFKRLKWLKSILALCFADGRETYHHWRVFSHGSDGVRIEFDREKLLSAFADDAQITARSVEYKKIQELKDASFEVKALPFLKRDAFRDEVEFRIIFADEHEAIEHKDYLIDLNCIRRITERIVCFDDLERKGEKLRIVDILGLATLLAERRKCKVVIILNDEQLDGGDKTAFARYHEKVVDRSYVFSPTPQEAAAIAIPLPTELEAKLLAKTVALDLTNIRVIRKLQRLIHEVEPLMSKYHASVTEQVVSTLTLFGWMHYSRTDESDTGFLDFAVYRRGQPSQTPLSSEESKWASVLDRYGYQVTDELDLAILDGVRAGLFDSERLTPLGAELDLKAQNAQADSNLESAWGLYHDSLTNTADEVTTCIAAAFKENLTAVTISNLDATVRLFKNLEKPALALELLAYFIAHKQMPPRSFDLGSYSFRHHVSDPDVIKALASKAIETAKTRTPDEIFEKIATTNAWNDSDIDLLTTLSEDDFYKMFKTNEGGRLRQIMRGTMDIASMQSNDPRYPQIGAATKRALQRIASESVINRLRLADNGIQPIQLEPTNAGSYIADPRTTAPASELGSEG